MKEDLDVECRNLIRNGETQKAIELLEANEELRNANTSTGPWLHLAARCGDLNLVKYLVSKGGKGGDVNIFFDEEQQMFERPIFSAVNWGHISVVQYLIKMNSVINESKSEVSPLITAITCGEVEIAKLIIEAGIDLTTRYKTNGKTAMDFAKEYGLVEIIDPIKAKLEIR